jgi:hypothetical protein
MCFTDYFYSDLKQQSKLAFINNNQHQYLYIKDELNSLDKTCTAPINVNTQFKSLFMVYNLATSLDIPFLAQFTDDIIKNKFTSQQQMYLLCQEYISIYEN